MLKVVSVAAVVGLAASSSIKLDAVAPAQPEPTFADWCSTFGKCTEFGDAMDNKATVYADNVKFIETHNVRYEAGLETFNMGVNEYSAMSHEEFKAHFNLGVPMAPRNHTLDAPVLPTLTKLSGMDASVDWRTKGAVTPVKNQGQCGSCWSFSTTGSMEGRIQISTGTMPGGTNGLSEQQLMDCSTKEGNQGCNGGLMDNAFKYVITNGGIDSEADYPYTMKDGTCDKAKEADDAGVITSFKDVTPDSDSQMEAAVTAGPVSVAIEADQRSFQSYKSGILSAACGTKLDHGVLVVGFGTDYWIVKNSWGATWGMEGFIELTRQATSSAGECGVLSQPSYPIAGKPGPTPPTPPGPAPPPPGPPSTGPYEDPNPGCAADEEAVQITGVSGSFCSPKCTGVIIKKCPANPSGTAEGKCVLEMSGSSTPSQCALICTPSALNADSQCPGTATCQAISGTGICTYAA